MDILIRIATQEDVPGIRQAIRSSIEGLAARDYSQEVLDSWGVNSEEAIATQRMAIRTGAELTWVALYGEIIVGFSALGTASAVIRGVYVAAQVARLGVGSRLLAKIETRARALGIESLSLHSSITARAFYLHHGYEPLRETVHTLKSGATMMAIAMTKKL